MYVTYGLVIYSLVVLSGRYPLTPFLHNPYAAQNIALIFMSEQPRKGPKLIIPPANSENMSGRSMTIRRESA